MIFLDHLRSQMLANFQMIIAQVGYPDSYVSKDLQALVFWYP